MRWLPAVTVTGGGAGAASTSAVTGADAGPGPRAFTARTCAPCSTFQFSPVRVCAVVSAAASGTSCQSPHCPPPSWRRVCQPAIVALPAASQVSASRRSPARAVSPVGVDGSGSSATVRRNVRLTASRLPWASASVAVQVCVVATAAVGAPLSVRVASSKLSPAGGSGVSA